MALEYIHFCGPFSNGTKQCCKYCKQFHLWGTSTGYCSVIHDDTCSFTEACENFEEIEGEPANL